MLQHRPLVRTLLVCLLVILSFSRGTPSSMPSAQAQSFDCSIVTEIPCSECEALVALYNSTDGVHWIRNSGWLQNNAPSGWEGVGWQDGRVQSLNLSFNQLSGSIPAELGNLANLKELYLIGNQLSGSIPAELGNLANLEIIPIA